MSDGSDFAMESLSPSDTPDCESNPMLVKLVKDYEIFADIRSLLYNCGQSSDEKRIQELYSQVFSSPMPYLTIDEQYEITHEVLSHRPLWEEYLSSTLDKVEELRSRFVECGISPLETTKLASDVAIRLLNLIPETVSPQSTQHFFGELKEELISPSSSACGFLFASAFHILRQESIQYLDKRIKSLNSVNEKLDGLFRFSLQISAGNFRDDDSEPKEYIYPEHRVPQEWQELCDAIHSCKPQDEMLKVTSVGRKLSNGILWIIILHKAPGNSENLNALLENIRQSVRARPFFEKNDPCFEVVSEPILFGN